MKAARNAALNSITTTSLMVRTQSRTSSCSPATRSSFANFARHILQIVTVVRLVIIVTSVVVVGVCPAYSQGAAPRRPAGGLFGATRSDVSAADKLNFTFVLAEGLESAVPPDLASRVSRELQSGGFSTQLAAASDFAHTGKRL